MTTLLKPLRREDHERIHAMLIGMCLDGHCYALAIALSRGTGWPMVGLMEGKVIRHALVVKPGGLLWDARGGVIGEAEIARPFNIKPPYELRPVSEDDLNAIKPIGEAMIESVLRKAQVVWPELPWRRDTPRARVLAFTCDLERLSRKHGLWVRACFPATPPVIAEGVGDERGYKLEQTVDGLSYTIDRVIGNEKAYVLRRRA